MNKNKMNNQIDYYLNGTAEDYEVEIPNEETKKAIEDTRNGIGLMGPFNSVQELMDALEADDAEDN